MQLSDRILKQLTDIFGPEAVTAEEILCVHGSDASRQFAMPLALVRPSSLEELVELAKLAHAQRIPLYPRGRATNVVGDCVPERPGIVVSFLGMSEILDIDADDFVAVAQPGLATGDLQKACEARSLFYPPDPASVAFSSIGGNVATCAGGMRALKYGVTRDYVLGLTAVLPGGEVIRTGGRSHKNVVGLDLTRLLVGSEGTLALTAEVTLKLLPRPETTASLLASFQSTTAALNAAAAVFRAGLLPVAMEFFDATTLRALSLSGPLPWRHDPRDENAAALLIRLDGSRAAVDAELKLLERAVDEAYPKNIQSGTGAEEEALWEVRRGINQGSFNIAPDKLSDDIAVPRGKLGEAVARVRAIEAESGLSILAFGHLGDGNLHINVMYDGARQDQTERAKQAKAEVQELALELGGTLSGEHGIGRTKLAAVGRQLSETERTLMRGVKHAFDPHGIMNPGAAY